ncbi:OprD family porin [Pseudomonas stutzeri]|nr:OprD family porin [Stutzerimonas stutzeri]
MQLKKLSIIAVAVAAASSQLALASAQSESKGFVEDSSLNVLNRVLYMNRDFKNGAANTNSVSGKTNGYREETGLGIRVLYESGFTQGTVGFGLDAHSLTSIKLDSGEGRTGTGQFALDSDGTPEDTQSEIGGALKARLSNTTLKYGSQFVESPVFSTDDARILPEAATGTYLVSNEIDGLELSAGRFTALSGMTATTRDSEGLKSLNLVGANYSFTDNFSAGLHASNVEDYFKKTYVNLNYNLPLGEARALNFDVNAYRTKDEGDALLGQIDNKIWSLATAYSMGAHKFTLAYQRSSGDSAYAYGIDGGGTVWLANSVQISDFDREDEKSWQVRYDLDMAAYGVPGLSFMTRYITGDNITTSSGVEGKEKEFNFETRYVVQDGAAKDLSLRLRSSIYRGNSALNADYYSDMNDLRLIVEYPLSIL